MTDVTCTPAPPHGEPPALAAWPSLPRPADRPRRVLVVEDNWDSAESLKMLAELLGHEVRVAETGTEGVRLGVEWVPDVVVSDLGLPELDGLEVARALRRSPAPPTLIAVTATRTTGRTRSRSRTATSSPSMPGMFRSIMHRPGRNSAATSIADGPS